MPQTAAQLANQRVRANRDLTGLCEIHRYGETVNTLGERIKSWSPVATGVACRVVSVGTLLGGGQERLRLDAIAQVVNWVLVLPWNTDVTAKDRIFVTSPTPVRTFEAVNVLGPHTDEIRRRVMVNEVS